ncbi:hypothetical protein LTS18_003362 [Coniosporium uncinatum]|uniref:Uncharacterized protein n=1 Tax=Coniosporium uncinatum TaxID=93489 RepID=A0ACC3DC33_9PEZI|nr:hypothetical protein LTS18_003362 [Coniosporium uncinatum]
MSTTAAPLSAAPESGLTAIAPPTPSPYPKRELDRAGGRRGNRTEGAMKCASGASKRVRIH